jgi:hypothetical protein
MREEEILQRAFAMPLTSPSYPPGPYRFVNREADHGLRPDDLQSVQHAGATRYNPANTRRSMLVKVSRCGDLRRSTLS